MPDAVPLRHKRDTARGIVVHNGRILFIERWRPGMHYFSIPGGGIEKNETPEQTVEREIKEETSMVVRVKEQVLEMHDGEFSHKIYLCERVSGEPKLPPDAPEALHMGDANRFKPGWVPIERLPELPFTYWQPLKQPLIDGLANGFKQPVKVVATGSPR